MTAPVRVRVPAKVNLALGVGGTDERGYHELATVFQALSLFDEITAGAAPPGTFSVDIRGEGAAFLPTDETNLALRAARLLAQRFKVADAGVALRIRKRIPVAGGMAGGSADAAGALVACDALWGTGAGPAELSELADALGSDVPFLLLGGTALGTGRGDVLRRVPSPGTYHWTLALSHAGLSTPAVFREFDAAATSATAGPAALPDGLLEALAAGDVAAVGRRLSNDLQEPALNLLPALRRTLDIGLSAGALGAVVSGSGPTCAFLSANRAAARAVGRALEVSSSVRAVRLATGPVPGAAVLGRDRV